MGKLTKDMKFEDILNNRVDMERVDLESIKPWISNRITDLIKQEDEVLVDYIYNQLDIKFPDPKEIQSNLSGFLSFTNARIFTGELWKELINAMGSNGSTKNGSQRINNDKVKSFPRLGPTENKSINNENINRTEKSFEKKDERHYRSTGSRSESVSSRFNSRIRSMSSNNHKYRFDTRHRNKIRSRTKSSSRYTPYTRYSRYTESNESSSNTDTSASNYNIRSYSTSSSSSSCQTDIPLNLHCDSKTKGVVNSRNSNSMSPVINTNCNEQINKAVCCSDSTESIEIVSKEISPFVYVKCTSPYCYTSNGSSCTVSFVSPQNNQSRQISQSLYSSSSEYSIEYREKTFFTKSQQCMSGENCFNSDIESESEVEWVTATKLRELHEAGHIRYEEHCFYFFEQSSDHLRSLKDSESESCTDSETSISDIEWVELDQFRQLSNEYFRV